MVKACRIRIVFSSASRGAKRVLKRPIEVVNMEVAASQWSSNLPKSQGRHETVVELLRPLEIPHSHIDVIYSHDFDFHDSAPTVFGCLMDMALSCEPQRLRGPLEAPRT
jgi:hypothetical protein